MAFEFLKKMGGGMKSSGKAKGGGQNLGAFLRYFLDEDLRKKRSASDAESTYEEKDIPKEYAGLPLEGITYKDGKPVPSYKRKGARLREQEAIEAEEERARTEKKERRKKKAEGREKIKKFYEGLWKKMKKGREE